MRAWTLAIAISLVAAADPPAPPRSAQTQASPARDPRVDELLRGWEAKGRGLRDLQCEFQRISTDAVFKTEQVEYGKASGIKPYLGRLDLMDKDGRFTQIFVYDGKTLHQYEFKTKQEIVHVLPDSEVGDGKSMPGPLGFVYGMPAAEAKARFNLTLTKEFARDGVEYAVLQATPRTAVDQQDFKVATLVIDKKTFLPRQIRIEEPNGNMQDWIFNSIATNVSPPVPADSLAPLKTPKDWKKIINKYGEQPGAGDTSKAKSAAAPSKQSSGTARSTAPNR